MRAPVDDVRPFTWERMCVGTLIGERLVLTTKACADTVRRYLDGQLQLGFVVDGDARKPERGAMIIDAEPAPPFDPASSGPPGIGVLYLEQALVGITPLEVATSEDAAVGGGYLAVGYGSAEADWEDKGGTRRAGEIAVTATQGPWLPRLFGSFAAYHQWYTGDAPGCSEDTLDAGSCGTQRELRARYDRTLEDERLLLVANSPGAVRPCTGDEGGPLLRLTPGGPRVYGVYSHSLDLDRSSAWEPRCERAALYASIPREAQERIRHALAWIDPCVVPAQRYCDGELLRVCKHEAGRDHRLALDCPSRGLRCMERADHTLGCGP